MIGLKRKSKTEAAPDDSDVAVTEEAVAEPVKKRRFTFKLRMPRLALRMPTRKDFLWDNAYFCPIITGVIILGALQLAVTMHR